MVLALRPSALFRPPSNPLLPTWAAALASWCLPLGRQRPTTLHWQASLTLSNFGGSLGISVETVKTHVVNAKDKLGAADRTQLAVMALLYGLIDPLG